LGSGSSVLGFIALCTLVLAGGCSERRAETPVAVVSGSDRLISAAGISSIRLGETLDQSRRSNPAATFARATDGDGAALVGVNLPGGDGLSLWAGEDDPGQPIDRTKPIETIEVFTAAFHTTEGIHVGMLVTDVERRFGPVRQVTLSEIEQRQYVEFARQPAFLTFRLDYTGIFVPGAHETTRFEPGAKIFSIAVSMPNR